MKTFALALGAGGARGLAHIAVIEALDEMGVKPVGDRRHLDRRADRRRLCGGNARQGHPPPRHRFRPRPRRDHAPPHCRPRRFARRCFRRRIRSSGTIDAEKICTQFLPEAVPQGFPELAIPLTVMTTDLHRREEAALTSGPLPAALAASIAIPGLLRPVALGERVLIDGGTTNPLPFDRLRGLADVIVAIDVLRQPPSERADIPGPWASVIATLNIMGSAIVAAKLALDPPDHRDPAKCRHFPHPRFLSGDLHFARRQTPPRPRSRRQLERLLA